MGKRLLPERLRLTVLDSAGEPLLDSAGVPVHRVGGQAAEWHAIVHRAGTAILGKGNDLEAMRRHIRSGASTIEWGPSRGDGALASPIRPAPPADTAAPTFSGLRVAFTVPRTSENGPVLDLLTSDVHLGVEAWGPDLTFGETPGQWPYFLWPHLTPEAFEEEGDLLTITMMSAPVVGWGTGPYRIDIIDSAPGPLPTPFPAGGAYLMGFVSAAPPALTPPLLRAA